MHTQMLAYVGSATAVDTSSATAVCGAAVGTATQPLVSKRRKMQPGRWHGSGAKVGAGSGRSGTGTSDATQLLLTGPSSTSLTCANPSHRWHFSTGGDAGSSTAVALEVGARKSTAAGT